MKTLIVLLIALLLLPVDAASAAKRPHVVVRKPAPPPVYPAQPIAYPIAAIVPLAILYDLNRRLNCLDPPDPLGLGGPGFDGKPTPPTNIMVPCYERRYLAGQPTPR